MLHRQGHPLMSTMATSRLTLPSQPPLLPLRGAICGARHFSKPPTPPCSSKHTSPHTHPHRASAPGTPSGGKGFSGGTHQEAHHPLTEDAPHPHASSGSGARLLAWMQANGASEQAVTLRSVEPSAPRSEDRQKQHHHVRPLDLVVAARPLAPGTVALRVPETLVISLGRVFESEFVAELLTTDKLSELACLTLFLMYEKKLGEESFWQPYIKELDRQRARGSLAVESPLLWSPAELEDLLQGSPLLAAVKQRLQGIRREYEELDTVWYMSKSLFSKYPFDLPTETFSFELFKQAFAAVQACIVHLQGVPPARRFSLVPLGPPLLAYSSTSKAMLSWDEASRSVQLVVDREYEAGEPLVAWCGPQPNSRLLLNYGLVDEGNPYDKVALTAILATTDPLFQAKRAALQAAGLSTSQTFDLMPGRPLPALLLPYIRLAAAATPEAVQKVAIGAAQGALATQSDEATDRAARVTLAAHLKSRLAAYKHTLEEDEAVIADMNASQRRKVAARLTRIEKRILRGALDEVHAGEQDGGPDGSMPPIPYLKLT